MLTTLIYSFIKNLILEIYQINQLHNRIPILYLQMMKGLLLDNY